MQLFYNGSLTYSDKFTFFEKEESVHIHRVLRKKAGDIIHITDGKGNLYLAKIDTINDKKCNVILLSCEPSSVSDYHLHLAIAPTKMNERFEWFLEKATEIGIHEITPIICEHSERKTIKTERFEKIIISAMKQSLQFHKPLLNPPIDFSSWITTIESEQKFIAHCQEGNRSLLFDELYKSPKKNITILIGPEGDFSKIEIEKSIQKEFIPVSLSAHRLRTETAGIVACNTVADIMSQKK